MKVLRAKGFCIHFHRAGPEWLIFMCTLVALTLTRPFLSTAFSQADIPSSTSIVAPRSASSAIAITPTGNLLVTVNPDSNSITLIDTTDYSLLTEIAVGVAPRSVAVSPSGELAYVTNEQDSSLSVIDLQAKTLLATLSTGWRPAGVAASPDGQFIAIAEMGADTVLFLDARDFSTLARLSVQDRPYGLAFTPDSLHLLVTHLLSGKITLIDVQPPFKQFLPFLTHNTTLLLPAAIADAPFYNWFTLLSYPRLSSSISTWLNVAPAPGVTLNQAGTRAYLPQTMANGLGLNTQFDATVFPKVSVLNLVSNTHQTTEHISLPETDRPVGLPWDVTLTKDDKELWVVNSASNDISVINLTNPTFPTRQAHIPVSANPRGIAIHPTGNPAYVNNTLSGTLSVIDTAAYTVTQAITVTHIPLPPVLLNGKRLYFSSARPDLAMAGWISCNTCHIEGEADGRTWLLQYLGSVPPGEEPIIRRNTTGLLGMIETYPLRWSAEWDESADSEFSVRFEQFGTGLIDGSMNPTLGPPNQGRSYDLDCLAAFIDSLEVPAREHTLTAAEQRGKNLFESPQTQCATCHPAPLYTDLQVHDVGTADGDGEWFGPLIDTPTLRFLFDSAPYLHDGSAATLYDVLTTHNLADEHGVTSQLSESELQDLLAFLLALPHIE